MENLRSIVRSQSVGRQGENMKCEQCGEEKEIFAAPLCYDCYVECMEAYDEAMGKTLAEFIKTIGSIGPGFEVHFPTDKGMMKMENGQISLSKYGGV